MFQSRSTTARITDFAWASVATLVNGVGHRTVKRGFDDLMSVGCPVIHRFKSDNDMCLTFDDSPSPHSTMEILASLKLHDIRATFYCIGENARRYPSLAKAIADDGHEIGNHTMTHPDLYRLTPRHLREEVAACQKVLRKTCGVPVTTFRAPFGHFRWDLRYATQGGIERFVKWDVAPSWLEWDHNVLTRQILHSTKGGSIVLLHDGLAGTEEAHSRSAGLAAARTIEFVAPALKASGLRFKTVSEQISESIAETTAVGNRNFNSQPHSPAKFRSTAASLLSNASITSVTTTKTSADTRLPL